MLWDLNEGKHLYSLEAGDIVNALVFSPNRYWLCAATASCIKIFDLESKWVHYCRRSRWPFIYFYSTDRLLMSSNPNLPMSVPTHGNQNVCPLHGQQTVRRYLEASPTRSSVFGPLAPKIHPGEVAGGGPLMYPLSWHIKKCMFLLLTCHFQSNKCTTRLRPVLLPSCYAAVRRNPSDLTLQNQF